MPSIAPPAHTRGEHTTDDWITPKKFQALGEFDLDPCESDSQPWSFAKRGYRIGRSEDGLMLPWSGEVWLNPPYGRATEQWLNRLALHNSGIALIFARTETRMFFKHVWPKASAILFLEGRLTFHHPDGSGSKAAHNSGGPSCLIAYGLLAWSRLLKIRDWGKMLKVNS